MKLSHFQFDLPKELLPIQLKTETKHVLWLLIKKGTIEHKMFKDVIDYFDDGDVLILNNTKVFQRVCMETKKTGARIEVFY
jgi:S-adenosylmethionine:tRNA ribosyltransferase-isomerase